MVERVRVKMIRLSEVGRRRQASNGWAAPHLHAKVRLPETQRQIAHGQVEHPKSVEEGVDILVDNASIAPPRRFDGRCPGGQKGRMPERYVR